jgi:hypothetical protein
VVSNKVYNSGDGGVAFNNQARGFIQNNFLYKCNLGVGAGPEGNSSDSDLTFNQMIISGNFMLFCNYGINLGWYGYAGRTGPTNFVVSGNTLKGCASRGIAYDGNNVNVVCGNIVGNNVLSLGLNGQTNYPGSVPDNAIRVLGANGVIISSNNITEIFTSTSSIGINVSNISRSVINGNNIISSLNAGTAYATGIVIGSGSYLTCTGNNIIGAGVSISAAAVFSTINNNNNGS